MKYILNFTIILFKDKKYNRYKYILTVNLFDNYFTNYYTKCIKFSAYNGSVVIMKIEDYIILRKSTLFYIIKLRSV